MVLNYIHLYIHIAMYVLTLLLLLLLIVYIVIVTLLLCQIIRLIIVSYSDELFHNVHCVIINLLQATLCATQTIRHTP